MAPIEYNRAIKHEESEMTFDVQRFEGSARQNGVLYWYAHEFMRELGYESWHTFKGVVNKAIASCARIGLDFAETFIADVVEIDGKEQGTYRLTRFACLLVTMHADSKKPEVAAAKAALASVADQLIQMQIEQNSLGRIETRDDLKAAEIVMSGAAKSAGVDASQMGIFKDAGFRGMYNMSLQELKRSKGIGPKDVAYDFMGLTELAGNLFRVTQTAERLKKMPEAGLTVASLTAKDVGKEVRGMMIKNSGVAPERLPLESDVNDLKKGLRSTARQMKKLDATGTKKTKPPQ